eukprot:CAMPEP_0177545372 /NCGR_PEP_ID=MMETSP0369-20130122/62560_1 /TAXON_ID=447022 ORGANISM="Scrippsiella hangoei-like, Strain SHHI-4" /NCGR_SAMPLE_ID=MMETSP0369 /ASSEMBLY_ACC=CAM_ASM_000364 /LENGTH=33 /DNA_ID= /DNA_START= /DNA_END= /DNA_ORIENTATION=
MPVVNGCADSGDVSVVFQGAKCPERTVRKSVEQ